MENTPKYCDAGSILLINPKGILRRLYCPFKVRCRLATGNFTPDTWLYVDAVSINTRDELIYIIHSKPYLYRFFEINISF